VIRFRSPRRPTTCWRDIAPNFPVVQDKLSIRCERGFDLGCSDALLDALDEALIKLCSRLVDN
jgi:hypothetical protein